MLEQYIIILLYFLPDLLQVVCNIFFEMEPSALRQLARTRHSSPETSRFNSHYLTYSIWLL